MRKIFILVFATLVWWTCGVAHAAPVPAEEAGFKEFPLGEEKQVGPLLVSGVYFQPVDMEPEGTGGMPAYLADMHLEADVKAIENNGLGYAAGEFVPYLTIRYRIQKRGGRTIEGSFMPMNARDGPHYGNNVKLSGPGNYTVTFIIDTPEKQNYLLNVDRKKGVKGRFWKEPLKVSWNIKWIPRKW